MFQSCQLLPQEQDAWVRQALTLEDGLWNGAHSHPTFQNGLQERRVLQQALMRHASSRVSFSVNSSWSWEGALLAAWLGAQPEPPLPQDTETAKSKDRLDQVQRDKPGQELAPPIEVFEAFGVSWQATTASGVVSWSRSATGPRCWRLGGHGRLSLDSRTCHYAAQCGNPERTLGSRLSR